MIEKNLYTYNLETDMVREKKREIGSITAKGGFENENDICIKFNNWKNDLDAQNWLKIMEYDLSKLEYLEAKQIPVYINKNILSNYNLNADDYETIIKHKKADAQIKLCIKIE